MIPNSVAGVTDTGIAYQLNNKIIDAIYEYLDYVRIPWCRKLLEETKDCYVNSDHAYAKFLGPIHGRFIKNKKEPEELSKELEFDIGDKSEETSIIFRKLALLFHPDKRKEPWAHKIFTRIGEYYNKNDLQGLKMLQQHWLDHGDFTDLLLEEARRKLSN